MAHRVEHVPCRFSPEHSHTVSNPACGHFLHVLPSISHTFLSISLTPKSHKKSVGGAGHGLHTSYSSCKAAPEQLTSEESYLGQRKNITGLSLSGPKSSFLMRENLASHLETKVPGFGGRMERHTIQDPCEVSSVRLPQS